MKKSLSIFKYCYKFGAITEETESYKTIEFEYEEQKYKVYSIKKPVRKSTIIHCENDGTLYREQLYAFGRYPSSVKTSLMKPTRQNNEIVIVLFSGVPNFRNIDDGIFISANNKAIKPSSIYVMTKATFKQFELDK